MESDVYHISLNPRDLPDLQQDIPAFVRSKVHSLIGTDAKGVDFSLERSRDENTLRLVLTVPQRLTTVTQRLASAGLIPLHTEPEHPIAGDNSCTIPRSFQVRHFGCPVNPQSLSNNPADLMTVTQTLLDHHAEDLPPQAFDHRLWLTTHSDPETGVLTVRW